MTNEEIIRAWTDEEYRRGLSAGERALIPANPVGIIELSDTELDFVAGAARKQCVTVNNTCTTKGEACCSIDTTSRLQGCPTC